MLSVNICGSENDCTVKTLMARSFTIYGTLGDAAVSGAKILSICV
jgi:hypothetical protein